MAKPVTKQMVRAYLKSLDREFTLPEICDHFQISRYACRWHMNHIRQRRGIKIGSYSKSGPSVYWVVCNPRVRIEDERGLHPNSLANLKNVMDRPMTRSRTSRDKVPKTWAGATELDKCWGLRSDSLDAAQGLVRNSAREGASAEDTQPA